MLGDKHGYESKKFLEAAGVGAGLGMTGAGWAFHNDGLPLMQPTYGDIGGYGILGFNDMRLRVERARRLLQRGISATRAAASVGFADQSHFTRCFRRIMRVTPSAYARATARSSDSEFLPAA